MPLSRPLLAGALVTLIAGLVWWWQSSPSAVESDVADIADVATTGVIQRSDKPEAPTPLRPSVVTAATKLGQGQRAVPGMPTVTNFELPVLRETAVGLALQIPNTALPARAAHELSKPDQATASASVSVSVRFDIYSWSEGVLVATADTSVELTPARNLPEVPDALEAMQSQFGTHGRLLLVLPVGAQGLPPALNPNDAFVLIAERVPASSS